METIKLKVTPSVLAHTQSSENDTQKQIALSCPTGSLVEKIALARRGNHFNITLENLPKPVKLIVANRQS